MIGPGGGARRTTLAGLGRAPRVVDILALDRGHQRRRGRPLRLADDQAAVLVGADCESG